MDSNYKKFKENVIQGNISIVRQYLNNNIDAYDNIALREAIKYKHIEIVQLLIEHGADIHAKNGEPLIIACEYGHEEIVNILIGHQVNIHKQDNKALLKACEYNHLNIVKILIGQKASIKGKHAYLLLKNAIMTKNQEMIELFMSLQSKYGREDLDRLLVDAVISGEIHSVQLFVKEGAGIKSRNYQAIREAIEENHHHLLPYLFSIDGFPIEEINLILKKHVRKKVSDIHLDAQLQTITYLVEQGADEEIILKNSISSLKESYITMKEIKNRKEKLEDLLSYQEETKNKPKL